MKKIYSILTIAVAAVIMTSCNDYLDVKPTNQLDQSELFKTEDGYEDALTGVYSNMAGTALYGKELTWRMLDLLGGYYYGPIYGTNSEINEYRYKHKDSNRSETVIGIVDNVWSGMYAQIANLNEILSTIDANKGVFTTTDHYNIIKGEALGLRAFLHLDLLRMFGKAYSVGKDSASIPYVDVLSTQVTPLYTVDAALKRIIEDLTEAKSLLANDPMHLGTTPDAVLSPVPTDANYSKYVATWHNRRFDFNYYAAIATLARAYLWKGDKANALACAKEVIDDQAKRFPWVSASNLTTIDGTSTNQDRTFATEQIFAMNEVNLENYIDGYSYDGEYDVLSSGDGLPMYNADNGIFEGNSADPRYQYLIKVIGYYPFSTKYYQSTSVLKIFQQRIPLIRLSEMYYIAAECEPTTSDGVAWLDEVRKHRGLSATPLSKTMSDEQLQTEILKEYRKEFVGEGQIWFYYKRHMATQIPSGYGYSYTFPGTDYYTFDRPDVEDTYGGR